MKKKILLYGLLMGMAACVLGGCKKVSEKEDVVTLRIGNWEEYIDYGDWDSDETIELEDGTKIIGENSMIDDFEEWYEKKYHQKVKVEYSTFGTNEDLYNQIVIGDTFDLVCPSEYMIMKFLSEKKLQPFSKEFYDASKENNYYAKGVSPYISGVFSDLKIKGKVLKDYAAGYMWGTLGFVYNPDLVKEEDTRTWKIFQNDKYQKQITIKDSVRDALFCAQGIISGEEASKPSFRNQKDYHEKLAKMMNDTSQENIDKVEDVLSQIKDNVYSFETDSGKADMVSGKVSVNMQWSGDGVYSIQQAAEDDCTLCYAVPEECTNLWFDGWCMLKDGIQEDSRKQQAAEAFINFLSRSDNVIRNMYYIGYTSVISGGGDNQIFQYIDYCYGAEDEKDAVSYPLGYFFSGKEDDKKYVLSAPKEELKGALFAQYPTKEVIARSAVMGYFDRKENDRVSRMWTNVRCFDLKKLFG